MRHDIALQERGPELAFGVTSCRLVKGDQFDAAFGHAEAGGGFHHMKVGGGHGEALAGGGIAEVRTACLGRCRMEFVAEIEFHGVAVRTDGRFDLDDGADFAHLEDDLWLVFVGDGEFGDEGVLADGFMRGAGAGLGFEEGGIDEAGLATRGGGFQGVEHGGVIRTCDGGLTCEVAHECRWRLNGV